MNSISHRVAAAGVALSACIGSPVRAQRGHADSLPLPFADAQRRALVTNPAFLAVRQQTVIALADVRQARLWKTNPQFEYDLPAGDATGAARFDAAISQEIEFGGQRGLRRDVARIGAERTAESVRDAARAMLAEVGDAYYTAWAAREQLAIAREIRVADDRLLAAIRAQLGEGEISQLESRLAEIELARNRARLLAAERESRSAHVALAIVAGLPGDTPIALVGPLPDAIDGKRLDLDSLVAVATRQRPDLRAAAAALRENETVARLAHREALPALAVRALAERDDRTAGSRFGIGFGMSIPLWNRNQGLVDRGYAAVQQARYEIAGLETRVRSEVTRAVQELTSAGEQLAIYERDVIAPARGQQPLLETAYREGKFDLAAFLLIRQQLLDAELSYWDAWLAQRRALIALDAATANSIATVNYLTTSGSEQ